MDFVAEWSIDDPGENLLRCNRYISVHSPKKRERKYVIRKPFSQKFKWTSKKQFRQCRWKSIARNPKNFMSMFERDINFFSSSFIFPPCPYGKQNAVLTTTPKLSAIRPKKVNLKSKNI